MPGHTRIVWMICRVPQRRLLSSVTAHKHEAAVTDKALFATVSVNAPGLERTPHRKENTETTTKKTPELGSVAADPLGEADRQYSVDRNGFIIAPGASGDLGAQEDPKEASRRQKWRVMLGAPGLAGSS